MSAQLLINEAAASSSSSDLTVVLFNCGPRKAPFENPRTKNITNRPVITGDNRKECVEQVLDRLPIGDECNLFLLVQDTISKAIHNGISDHVRRPAAGLHNRNTGVYSFSLSHDVEYLNREYLEQVSTVMTPASSRHLRLDRLTACVITQKRTRDKMLLVSWHGQYKVSDTAKALCYHALIDFLEQLQHEKECSSVMIGGDFNLSVDYAKQVLTQEKPELKGVVCARYPIPAFRAGSHKIDYIVRWPARYYNQLGRAASIRPHFEPNNGDHVENPFDHPIIKFRFTAGPPGAEETGQREQRIETLERHQKSRKEEVEELMKKVEEMNLRVNTLERQEGRHKEEVLEKDQRITALETKLKKEEKHHRKEDKEKNKVIKTLQAQLAKQEEINKRELRKNEEKDQEIERLNQQIEDLRTQIQQLRMDSTNRTTDSSPLPGSEEPEPR